MAQVRLCGLAKTYEGSVALQATDLDIRDGEFFTLLGPSGSGKTTLLRMIGGFVAPTAGRIEIGGKDVTALSPHLRNLGVVFQSYALFPHLDVRDNVAFGLKMRGQGAAERRRRAEEALDMVGLGQFSRRYPAQLSGGQQQRVALARALVIDPDVLLLDEPLGALDLALRKRMQQELRDLHRRLGRTFIYVTHDQDEALTLSDRIAVLSQGSVLQVDAPQALYDRPATAFVAGFLGDSNILPLLRDAAGVLRLSCGTPVPVEDNSALNGPLALSIRPERLRPDGAPLQGPAVQFAATVEAAVFRGAFVALRARTTPGELVEAHIPAGAGLADLAQGQPVTLSFAIGDARVVLADADAGVAA